MRLHPLQALLLLAGCGLAPYDPPGQLDPITGLAEPGPETDEVPDPSASSSSSTSGVGDGESATSEPAGTSIGLDLGTPPELGVLLPAGCVERKIDFLFLVSTYIWQDKNYPAYLASLPEVASTIETKFADFDVHIMVANPDGYWGAVGCDDYGGCSGTPPQCDSIPNYPCGAIEDTTECDWTIGAGVVFPAGNGASNHPCSLVGGRRYILDAHPNKQGAFECIATLGNTGGWSRLGDAMLAALSPKFNALQGCNAGFYREDALLVVVFYDESEDASSTTPEEWYEGLLAAKRGDLRGVGVLGVINDMGLPEAKCPGGSDGTSLVRDFIGMVPNGVNQSTCSPSFAPAFETVTDLVLQSCSSPIPG